MWLQQDQTPTSQLEFSKLASWCETREKLKYPAFIKPEISLRFSDMIDIGPFRGSPESSLWINNLLF
jgi:hypothetical protein